MSKNHKAVTSRCGEIQTRFSKITISLYDKQARCSGKYQQLGLPSPSKLVVAKTLLATASALCLSKIEHEIQNSTYCSQFELSRCGENPTHCYEYSQLQGLTNPSLLVAVIFTPATTSASYLK